MRNTKISVLINKLGGRKNVDDEVLVEILRALNDDSRDTDQEQDTKITLEEGQKNFVEIGDPNYLNPDLSGFATQADLAAISLTPGPPGDDSDVAGPPGLNADPPELPQVIPGGPGIDGTIGRDGLQIPPRDPDDPELPMVVPGERGIEGAASTIAGPPGAAGYADDPELPMVVPGERGLAGTNGADSTVPGPPGLNADDPEMPLVIPGKDGVPADSVLLVPTTNMNIPVNSSLIVGDYYTLGDGISLTIESGANLTIV